MEWQRFESGSICLSCLLGESSPLLRNLQLRETGLFANPTTPYSNAAMHRSKP